MKAEFVAQPSKSLKKSYLYSHLFLSRGTRKGCVCCFNFCCSHMYVLHTCRVSSVVLSDLKQGLSCEALHSTRALPKRRRKYKYNMTSVNQRSYTKAISTNEDFLFKLTRGEVYFNNERCGIIDIPESCLVPYYHLDLTNVFSTRDLCFSARLLRFSYSTSTRHSAEIIANPARCEKISAAAAFYDLFELLIMFVPWQFFVSYSASCNF